jgi:hypothetical protein
MAPAVGMSTAFAEQVLDHPSRYSKQIVKSAAYIYSRFVEETIITVVLWVGLWGFVSGLIDEYVKENKHQMIVYAIISIIAFILLINRGHIPL